MEVGMTGELMLVPLAGCEGAAVVVMKVPVG
jgi:hypothetical protein